MSKELEALELLKVYELAYPKVVEKPFKVYPINPNINREKTTIGEVFKNQIPLIEKALKEHEQYKAIEKELEMPIDKFFQALFGSAKMLKVWCIHPHKGLQEMFLSGFENHETARYFNAFNIDVGSITLGLSQYGKTWALTKEELENGKETS